MARVLVNDDERETKMPFVDKAIAGNNTSLKKTKNIVQPVEIDTDVPIEEPVIEPVETSDKKIKNNSQMYLLIGVVLLAIIIGVMLFKNIQDGKSTD